MKMRLDMLLKEKELVPSRRIGADTIRAGLVKVDGKVRIKPSAEVEDTCEIVISSLPAYVGRGGYKLEAALEKFAIDVSGRTVLDVGSSTGGFTDCLLQRGASHVFAVDVGSDQLAPQLKADPRVTSMEETDIRKVRELPATVTLAVIDVSFISLVQVLPTVMHLTSDNAQIIALVKPQFEVSKDKRKKGIVKEETDRLEVLQKIQGWLEEHEMTVREIIESPIKGVQGNTEYLMHIAKQA